MMYDFLDERKGVRKKMVLSEDIGFCSPNNIYTKRFDAYTLCVTTPHQDDLEALTAHPTLNPEEARQDQFLQDMH